MSVNVVKSDGSLERVAGGTLYADAPIGTIVPFGGSTVPSAFLLCDGQAVSRTDYAKLFAVIGTAFGEGDGSTTFNVPDLRETVPVGVGENDMATIASHDTYTLGQFKDDQLQDHQHYHYSGKRNGWSIYAADSGVSTYGMLSTNSTEYNNGSFIGEVYKGRAGTTTHGKQLGVNYIIKAVQTAVPADIKSAVADMLTETEQAIAQNASDIATLKSSKQDKLVTTTLTDKTVNYYGVVDLGFTGKQVVSCRSVSGNTIGRLMSYNNAWYWEVFKNEPHYPNHADNGTVIPSLVVTYIA